MRLTITIDDSLLHQAKTLADKQGKPIDQVLEQGLREVIRQDAALDPRRPPLVIHKSGGTLPGINIDKTSQVLDYLDECDAVDRRERADKRDTN